VGGAGLGIFTCQVIRLKLSGQEPSCAQTLVISELDALTVGNLGFKVATAVRLPTKESEDPTNAIFRPRYELLLAPALGFVDFNCSVQR